jgi:hypothetical protein
MTRRVLLTLILVATAGCAERRPPSALDQIAKAPMQAGVGLGELKLLKTTLSAFTHHYPLTESVVTTNETGAKIDFIKQGMTFLFQGAPECAKGLSEYMADSSKKGDINDFLLQHPDCETMLLESIAAWIPASGDPVYQGETVEGIGLNATRALAEQAYKRTQNALAALESGMPMAETEITPANEIHYPGIRLYLGKDANGNEVVRKLEVIPRQ